MARFEWVGDRVPEGMRITQVYGIILDREGRVMLRLEKTAGGIRYSLGGGRPEPFDDGIEATCRRELLEEVNTEIETPVYIGYQLVDEGDGTPPYAQVRMAALIRRIGEKKPDPDNGETYDRYMVSPERAAELAGHESQRGDIPAVRYYRGKQQGRICVNGLSGAPAGRSSFFCSFGCPDAIINLFQERII